MQFFYDHLTAAVVGTIVLLMVVAVQFQGQTANVESGAFYMNRVQSLSFIEIMERDFPNIGSGVTPGVDPMITAYDWSGETRYFEFWATVEAGDGATVELIRYEARPTEVDACTRAGEECVEVHRLIHDGTDFRPTGRSQQTLAEFEIELLPAGAALEEVREVRVRMAALSAMPGQSAIGRSVWETRYRPVSLSFQP
jgi:hypothetical protein